jgi:hypothetical protein
MFAPRYCFVTSSVFIAIGSASAADAPLQPFHADYTVSRNGKEMGKATLDLRNTGNDWEFLSQTHGTAGMAAMLGVDVQEKSTFKWNASKPECLTYNYSQKALKSRTASITCDWNAKSANVDDNGKTANVALAAPAMDRHLVALALMVDLKSGAPALNYPVIEKDQISDQRYVQSGHEIVSLGSTNVDTVKVSRDRGADSKRQTTYWFAPQRGWMPVQIEQVEKNGETITMRLATAK